MKKTIGIFACLGALIISGAVVSPARADNLSARKAGAARRFLQKNLIGEVVSIDPAGNKLTIQTDQKTTVAVAFNEQTVWRRVAPGQTSLAAAETIKLADLKIGDRVLVPGGGGDLSPARQIIVMARAALDENRTAEQQKRRARTTAGRITSVNADKREITIQTRGGRANAETLIVTAPASAKLQRYAPDSLKLSDAVAASFADLKIGDQVRVVGDRSATDNARVNAEEIVAGSVTRMVGTVTEVDQTRGTFVIKNEQTGQSMTVATGKNTTLRRITPEVAAELRQRFERRQARRAERNAENSNQTNAPQREQRRNRDGNRNADGQANNRRQLFENLPAIAVSDLKKGDAVLITGTTNGGTGAQQALTAATIIAGDGDLQQILLRTQGGRNGNATSPGLPGNVSGGNAGGSDDDEPQR